MGSLLLSNTEARVKKLVSEISDILKQGRISRSKARHGGTHELCEWTDIWTLSKSCLKAFYSVLERSSTELDPGTVAALSMYFEIAQHAPARTINLGQRPCVFVYTDASLGSLNEVTWLVLEALHAFVTCFRRVNRNRNVLRAPQKQTKKLS